MERSSPKDLRSHPVREHIPLEQGLRRLRQRASGCQLCCVREHIPLEQGLRLLPFSSITTLRCMVREHIPLEQGLRQYLA